MEWNHGCCMSHRAAAGRKILSEIELGLIKLRTAQDAQIKSRASQLKVLGESSKYGAGLKSGHF